MQLNSCQHKYKVKLVNISFQETFTSNEMMMFKISNNVVEEKIHKIVNANEKLKSVFTR